MGWDICTVGRHNLDITDIGKLAKELSTRFSINIIYGYIKSEVYDFDAHAVRPCDSEFVELGRALVDDGPILYHLVDDNGGEKEILWSLEGKFEGVCWEEYCRPEMLDGPQIFSLDLMDDTKNNPCDIYYMYIYKESCSVSLRSEPFRWSGFRQNFIEHSGWKNLDVLTEFRRHLMDAYERLGVKKIYYYSDQGATQLNDGLVCAPWEEMERYILEKRCFDDIDDKDYKSWKRDARLIDISAFLTGRDPHFSNCPSDTFVDDFSDLKEH